MKTIAISIHAEFYTKILLEAMPLNIKSQKEKTCLIMQSVIVCNYLKYYDVFLNLENL